MADQLNMSKTERVTINTINANEEENFLNSSRGNNSGRDNFAKQRHHDACGKVNTQQSVPLWQTRLVTLKTHLLPQQYR